MELIGSIQAYFILYLNIPYLDNDIFIEPRLEFNQAFQ